MYELYEFFVMPFEFISGPTIFCNLMNDVLYRFLDHFVMVYLDDIVVYNDTLDKHKKHLNMVFQRPREHQLYVKKKKCKFSFKNYVPWLSGELRSDLYGW